jgi:hypothetical protein
MYERKPFDSGKNEKLQCIDRPNFDKLAQKMNVSFQLVTFWLLNCNSHNVLDFDDTQRESGEPCETFSFLSLLHGLIKFRFKTTIKHSRDFTIFMMSSRDIRNFILDLLINIFQTFFTFQRSEDFKFELVRFESFLTAFFL